MALETEGKMLDLHTARAGTAGLLADESRGVYFLAEVEAAVVGQTMVTYEWSDWRNRFFWWIQSVYVDPPWRRQGVYRALYGHVGELARQEGNVCGLRLYVIRSNQPAIAAYQQLGMRLSDYLICEQDFPA